MPAARCFVDTNVLLYSMDSRDAAKRARARVWLDFLWKSGLGRLSWQVLHEFYANAERKMGVPSAQARATVMLFIRWKPVDMTAGLMERGWYWMDKAGLSYWDSMILAAAERLGCSQLLSEDLAAGREYEGVRVVNPFRELPAL